MTPAKLTADEREAKRLAELDRAPLEMTWSHAQDCAPWGAGGNRENEQVLRRLAAKSKARIDVSPATFRRADEAESALRDRMALHARRLPPIVVDNVGLSLGAHGGLIASLLERDRNLVEAGVRVGVLRLVGGAPIESFATQFIIDWPDAYGRSAATLEGRWPTADAATGPAASAGDYARAAWPWGLGYARTLLAQRGTADVIVFIARDAFDAIALLAAGIPAVAVGPREPTKESAAELRAALPAGATIQFAFEVPAPRMRALADVAAMEWARAVADVDPSPVLILESGRLTDAALAISARWRESERVRRGGWPFGPGRAQ